MQNTETMEEFSGVDDSTIEVGVGVGVGVEEGGLAASGPSLEGSMTSSSRVVIKALLRPVVPGSDEVPTEKNTFDGGGGGVKGSSGGGKSSGVVMEALPPVARDDTEEIGGRTMAVSSKRHRDIDSTMVVSSAPQPVKRLRLMTGERPAEMTGKEFDHWLHGRLYRVDKPIALPEGSPRSVPSDPDWVRATSKEIRHLQLEGKISSDEETAERIFQQVCLWYPHFSVEEALDSMG